MTQEITKPGVYSMSSAEYHADPCKPMSLSSTGARTLVKDCPALFLWKRDNSEHKNVFDIGTAGHLMVLEPHLFDEQIVVVRGETAEGKPSDSYRTKEAKAQRDMAYRCGKTPLLVSEVDKVRAMRDVIWNDPVASMAFREGRAEQSMFWRDKEFDVWCRTRPDFVPSHGRYLVDYKTAASANPDDFSRAIANLGYHQQAAWYLDGYEAVTGIRPGAFWFIVQMKDPPYLVSICRIDQSAIEAGRMLNRYAKGVLAWCLEKDRWPGFQPEVDGRTRIYDVGLPGYAMKQLDDGAEVGAFEPPALVKEMA